MDIRVLFLTIAEVVFAYWLLIRSGLLDSRIRIAAAVVLLLAAFLFRVYVLDYQTFDYRDFLSRWVDYFRTSGGFSALAGSVGNYNIPYLYFLAAFSYSTIPDLYLIKLLSIFFDIILAYSSEQLLGLLGKSKTRRLVLFFAVLFWPTVFLNGSLWGQCDSIYVSLALLSIYLVLDGRPSLGMTAIALSFGFKLQAVFLMPIFAVFLFQGKIRWKHLFVFPLCYLALVLPAVLIGRPFLETITLYFNQAGSIGSGLNYNSPSLFALWDHRAVADSVAMSKAGIVAAFSFMSVLLLHSFLRRKDLNLRCLLLLSCLFALGIPFLLPHMHDRYFYAADILTLILAFELPKTIPCAILTEFASLLGYHAYLKLQYLFLMDRGTIANAVSLFVLLTVYFLQFSSVRKRRVSQQTYDHLANEQIPESEN